MRKRLFVAINLPQEIKDRIKEVVREIQPLFDSSARLTTSGEIRFLKPENWHITITFLGYQPDDTIPAIIESMKQTIPILSRVIVFDRVIFGPPGRKPKMIWLTGTKETSQNLSKIKLRLEDLLTKNRVSFDKENRLFNTHLTLARFDAGSASPEIKLPVIENISFAVESLDLMESHLKRTGAEYETLVKVDFKQ